jgi:hypothetical protein
LTLILFLSILFCYNFCLMNKYTNIFSTQDIHFFGKQRDNTLERTAEQKAPPECSIWLLKCSYETRKRLLLRLKDK